MEISRNSSNEAIQGGDTKDKDEEIAKIKESRDDKNSFIVKISFRMRPVLLSIRPSVNNALIPLCHAQFSKEDQALVICVPRKSTHTTIE
jgi:hypothetical protein